MAADSTTRELIADCLARIESGDACAPLDLSSLFMSHADTKDIGLYLAVVEALAVIAKKQGCAEADKFLQAQVYDDIVGGRLQASDLAIQAYRNSARKYNRTCPPKGYPRLDLL